MPPDKQSGSSHDYGSAGRSLDDLKIGAPEEEMAKYPEADQRLLAQYYQEEMEKLKERLTFFLRKKGGPISSSAIRLAMKS